MNIYNLWLHCVIDAKSVECLYIRADYSALHPYATAINVATIC